MQSSSSSLCLSLLLSCLLLSRFHGVRAQDGFSFDSGKLNQASLKLNHGSVDSSGVLTLDSRSGDVATAFYSAALPLYDTISNSVLSFSTFFTFSSNTTTGNGTIAFVIVPDATATTGLAEARQTFTVELNTSCGTGAFNDSDQWGSFNGSYPDGPGGVYNGGGPGFRSGRGGFFDGFFGGGFQVAEYANGSSVAASVVGGYGPDWDPATYQNAPYFCSQQPDTTLYQYLVAIEYNATTDQVSIGSPSCGGILARTTTFGIKNLSTIPDFTKDLYVGFIVTDGAVYSMLQWNFTNNVTTNSVMSLALSSALSTPGGSGSGGGGGGGGAGGGFAGRGGSGVSKEYVIALSVLGAVIGVAAVVCTCCLCVRKRRVSAGPIFVAKSMASESKVLFEAKKPNFNGNPPPMNRERETAPLNTHPNSAFTGTASWLQPVAPR